MAAPTLVQIRDVVVAWWREPGAPRLAVLRARVAALWTDPGASVRVAIVNNAGTWSIVATLETRNPDGTIANTITRTWTPSSDDLQARIERVYNVQDDTGSTPAQRGEA